MKNLLKCYFSECVIYVINFDKQEHSLCQWVTFANSKEAFAWNWHQTSQLKQINLGLISS